MRSVNEGLDPLLKRPFSIHRSGNGDIQFLYRVVGKGTGILSIKKPGDSVEVLGPLGNNFTVTSRQKNIILIAGGLGIAPIFSLAESLIRPLSQPKKRGSNNKIMLFYGARTKDEILYGNELSSIGFKTVIATDDGTSGKKGNIISIFKRHIMNSSLHAKNYSIYACGPEAMLKSLSTFMQKHKLKGFAALEQNMACGLGTCLGCVVNTKHGYKRVCKEGPVFPIEDILWD
jgi:dihydroorotate dehydrogenase electron transfer subunit